MLPMDTLRWQCFVKFFCGDAVFSYLFFAVFRIPPSPPQCNLLTAGYERRRKIQQDEFVTGHIL